MATYKTNGFTLQDAIDNLGFKVDEQSQCCVACTEDQLTQVPIMAPRIANDECHVRVPFAESSPTSECSYASVGDIRCSLEHDGKNARTEYDRTVDSSHLRTSHLPKPTIQHMPSNIPDPQQALCNRLTKLCGRYHAARERVSCLLAQSAQPTTPNPNSSGSMCVNLIADELLTDNTESSSDDDVYSLGSTQTISNSHLTPSDNWHCSRSVSRSQWFWLQTELHSAVSCLHNLKRLQRRCCRWRKRLPLQQTDTFRESEECSRSTSFELLDRRSRHSYHNLRATGKNYVLKSQGRLRCSCKLSSNGPCINCSTIFKELPSETSLKPSTTEAKPADSLAVHLKSVYPGDCPLNGRLDFHRRSDQSKHNDLSRTWRRACSHSKPRWMRSMLLNTGVTCQSPGALAEKEIEVEPEPLTSNQRARAELVRNSCEYVQGCICKHPATADDTSTSI